MQKSVDLFDEELKKKEIIEKIIGKAIENLGQTKFKNMKITYKFRYKEVELEINSFVSFRVSINLYDLYYLKTSKTLEEIEDELAEFYAYVLRSAILKEWDSFILK